MRIGLPPKAPFDSEKEVTPRKEKDSRALYPYQKQGVKWLISLDGTGLLADDMGLGKSCQAATYLKINPEIRPVLIVCPASIKINWQREIKIWCDEDSFLITGKRALPLPKYPFYIINYDILADELKIKETLKNGKTKIKKVLKDSSWIFKLGEIGLKAIIADECQALANPDSIRSKAFVTLRKLNNKTKFIALSGTPIQSRPSEFFTILNLLSAKDFSNRWKFLHRYCGPKHNGFGWTFNGASNIKELHDRIKPFMLRRIKDDVLKDLPLKRKIIVPVEADQLLLKNYNSATDEFKAWIVNHAEASQIEKKQQIDRLRQLVYIAKRNSCISWIEQYLESGNKLVVGLWHEKAIKDLQEHFKKISVFIDGGVTGEKRQAAVDAFQNDSKIKLIICQILTVPGLTLTAASATCTIEFGWNPATHLQFEDRVHRIGQEADSVSAYYLIIPGTLDDDSMEMVNNKFGTVSAILDGKENVDLFDRPFMDTILKKYSKKSL